MYNFDKKVNRYNTASTKWDRYKSRYNLDDVTALWVADMDFEVEPKITEAMMKRAEHMVYGYTDVTDDVYQAIIDFEKRHHHLDLVAENIVMNTGVVYALYEMLNLLTTKEDKIIVMPPVYPPLFNTPLHLERDVVYCPLVNNDLNYHIDFDLFDKQLKEDPTIKCFILCNPHNPTGNCFSLEELNKLASICHENNVLMISDEIHSDLIMPGHTHYSLMRVDEKYLDDVIVMRAPTKTFNLAGMKVSYTLVKNAKVAEMLQVEAKASGLSSINIFGLEAIKAAFTYGDTWLEECINYVSDNFKFVKEYLNEHLSMIKFEIPESTYLGWMDLSALDLEPDYVEKLKFDGHVEFQGGSGFGEEYRYFIRINCATNRETIKIGLERLENWLRNNNKI